MGIKMEDKVYFIHAGGAGLAADFFVRNGLEGQYKDRADYLMEDCPYVKAFLKEHPDYSYVGSTDNMHEWG